MRWWTPLTQNRGETICDPACGTGGFLFLAHNYIADHNPNLTKADWSKNPSGRWWAYGFDELINRDKASLDIFWLKDESLEESENLPAPGILAQEIVEDLESTLDQFRLITTDLGDEAAAKGSE